MSSKSAIKLVVPEDDEVAALQVGGDPHRLEERAQGRRLLPRRPAARRWSGFRTSLLILAGVVLHRRSCVTASADARRPRPPEREGEVQADVLQQPRGQHARRRPLLPVRLARRLVRGRPAGLPVRPSSAGASGRSAASWPSGSSATASSRPRRRASSAGAPRQEAASPTAARRRGWRSCWRLFPAGDRARAVRRR